MTKKITEELARIQRELKAPKGQFNKFGKYNYRSCEDIMEGLKKVLGDCALKVSDSMEQVGNRIYVKATATLMLEDQRIEVSAFAREAENKKGMDEAQITGATSSYARKYALNGMFAIDDTKDADATNEHDDKEPATNSRRPSRGQQSPQNELVYDEETARSLFEQKRNGMTPEEANMVYADIERGVYKNTIDHMRSL